MLVRLKRFVRPARRMHFIWRSFGSVSELDWYTKPGVHQSWGGPLNGQHGRAEIMRKMSHWRTFDRLIETGTYRGTSSSFLADVFGARLHSVEASAELHRFAQRRYAGRSDIELACADSRSFLGHAAASWPLDENVLFYLDAHWEQDLPLWDELSIIFENWQSPVVVIDDFEVPGDDAYGFDGYGVGQILDVATLAQHLPPGIGAWSPLLPGVEETGARRGCVVLCRLPQSDGLDQCGLRELDVDAIVAALTSSATLPAT